MTKVINLWAGPGAGKSTIAADLFAEMKWMGINVELINETAKELTWEGHHNILQDQLYVSAMQNRKLQRLIDKVDWIITDSPLLLCAAYIPDHYKSSFLDMIVDMWNQYDNESFFIVREKPYNPVGRNQDEVGAKQLDSDIYQLMGNHINTWHSVNGNRNAKHDILETLGL